MRTRNERCETDSRRHQTRYFEYIGEGERGSINACKVCATQDTRKLFLAQYLYTRARNQAVSCALLCTVTSDIVHCHLGNCTFIHVHTAWGKSCRTVPEDERRRRKRRLSFGTSAHRIRSMARVQEECHSLRIMNRSHV